MYENTASIAIKRLSHFLRQPSLEFHCLLPIKMFIRFSFHFHPADNALLLHPTVPVH